MLDRLVILGWLLGYPESLPALGIQGPYPSCSPLYCWRLIEPGTWWWWWCPITKSCLTLWPHGLQHTRLPCPSLSPSVCSVSCPLSHWCHPTISSSATLFSFCLQSFLTSGPFPMSQIFSSGSQSIGASALASGRYSMFAKGIKDCMRQWADSSALPWSSGPLALLPAS